jgi:hypothetical protein
VIFKDQREALPVAGFPFLLGICWISELWILLGYVWSLLGVMVTKMVTVFPLLKGLLGQSSKISSGKISYSRT